MKKKIFILLAVFAVASLIHVNFSYAQEAKGEEQAVVTIATVNIKNAKIDSQQGGKLGISFELSNGAGIQPGVKYAVELVKTEGNVSQVYDSKVYSESVNLGENQKIKKTVEYEAPSFAQGNFEIWVRSSNEKGLGLAQVEAGKVKLSGNNGFIDIAPTACFLSIEGDQSKKLYTLDQGVDSSKAEKLIVNCIAKNNFKAQTAFTPNFSTYERNVFGNFISSQKGDPGNMEASGVRLITFAVPKQEKPQAYDAVLTLLDNQGKAISNSVRIHYVVQGESGTIQNVRLDKNDYLKGETAKVTFSWSGSADMFPGARNTQAKAEDVVVKLTVSDSSGKSCASPVEKKLSASDINSEVSVPVTSDCPGAKVGATLKDVGGKALDEYNVQKGKSSEKISDLLANMDSGKRQNYITVVLVATIILILIIIIYYIVKKRKEKNMTGIVVFLLMLSLGLFWGGKSSAETFTVGQVTTFTIGIGHSSPDRTGSVYTPGETLIASGEGVTYTCGNTHTVSLKATVNSQTRTIFDESISGNGCTEQLRRMWELYHCADPSYVFPPEGVCYPDGDQEFCLRTVDKATICEWASRCKDQPNEMLNRSKAFTVEDSSGTHYARFIGIDRTNNAYGMLDIPYTVSNDAPRCGPAAAASPYPFSASTFAGDFCGDGSPPTPIPPAFSVDFPPVGGSVSWRCEKNMTAPVGKMVTDENGNQIWETKDSRGNWLMGTENNSIECSAYHKDLVTSNCSGTPSGTKCSEDADGIGSGSWHQAPNNVCSSAKCEYYTPNVPNTCPGPCPDADQMCIGTACCGTAGTKMCGWREVAP